jgi:hypothetical protein
LNPAIPVNVVGGILDLNAEGWSVMGGFHVKMAFWMILYKTHYETAALGIIMKLVKGAQHRLCCSNQP